MTRTPNQPEDPQFRFRVFTEDDLPEMRRLYASPESVRYMTATGRPWSDADLLAYIANWQREFEQYGYTKWRVETATGQFIGRAGISPMSGSPTEAELGYCLIREVWGKGYATQLATIVRDWTWQATDLPYIIGMTHLGNAASQRVLTKIGMQPEGRRPLKGDIFEFFRLERPVELTTPTTGIAAIPE